MERLNKIKEHTTKIATNAKSLIYNLQERTKD